MTTVQPKTRGGGRDGGRTYEIVESIREATGASIEEIELALKECDGDVNKATEKLIDDPFTYVQNKKHSSRQTAKPHRGKQRTEGAARGQHRPSDGHGRDGGRTKSRRGRGRGRSRGRYNLNSLGSSRTGISRPGTEVEGKTAVNGTHPKFEEEEKSKLTLPASPAKKAYLEVATGKTPKASVTLSPSEPANVCSLAQEGKSKASIMEQDIATLAANGWEAAASPQDIPLATTRAALPLAASHQSREIPDQVDPIPEYTTQQPEQRDVEEEKVIPVSQMFKADVFPIPMNSIRFTREETPVVESHLPEVFKLESSFISMPQLNSTLDVSKLGYLFGSFEGVRVQPSSEEKSPAQETAPAPIPESEVTSVPVSPLQADTESDTRPQGYQRPSLDFLAASREPPAVEGRSAPEDLMGNQLMESDLSESQQRSTSTFMPNVNESIQDPVPQTTSLISASRDLSQSDNPYQISSQDNQREEIGEFTQQYQDAFAVSTETREEIPPFDAPDTRPGHRQRIQETKPMVETEQSFIMTSGPSSLSGYQQQRPIPTQQHKLSDKPLQPTMGGIPGHQQNPKYGGPPTGQTPNPPNIQVPMNSQSAGNQSTPMIPQVPFLNPNIIPNHMHYPPNHPYYHQYVQYQQMYHPGLYPTTYGGFGAPFNHETIGHPSHANAGVPANQGNQQFPVSFPSALYTLGNSYDNGSQNSFGSNKEKESVFLNPQLPHGTFAPLPQPPRNDGNLFYGMHGQGFSQGGIRTQFHQPPGFAGQFPGGGFVPPPHTYHPTGQQGSNFRLH